MSEPDSNPGGLPEDRQPMQDRSRASLTRMLDAARRLLVEHGSGEFSLGDVSRAGQVSIGSIYHRFESKDELLRAVHGEFMQQLTREQAALVLRAQLNSASLPELLANMVDEIAEFFRRHASLLRPMMICASKDPVISSAGAVGHTHLRNLFSAALLAYSAEMKRDQPQQAVVTCFKLTYAALGYELGFGAINPRLDMRNWDRLKVDLAEVCAAFLMTAPITAPVWKAKAKPGRRQPRTEKNEVSPATKRVRRGGAGRGAR